MSGEDVLIVICAREDVARIGADRDDGAVVLAREIDRSHDQLASYTLPFEAFEDTRMVDDHPLRGGTLVGQFADMDIVQPGLKKAVSFGFYVFDINHGLWVIG